MKMTIQKNFGYTGPVKRTSYLYKLDGKIIGRWVPAFGIIQVAQGKSYTDWDRCNNFDDAKSIMVRMARRSHLLRLLRGSK